MVSPPRNQLFNLSAIAYIGDRPTRKHYQRKNNDLQDRTDRRRGSIRRLLRGQEQSLKCFYGQASTTFSAEKQEKLTIER